MAPGVLPVAGGGEAAAVGFGERFGDGESDAGAALVGLPGGVAAVEALEDVRELFVGHALAGVGDADGHGVRGDGRRHVDAPPLGGVSERVGEQVAEDLGDALGVGSDRHVVDLGGEGDALGVVGVPGLSDRRLDEVGERLDAGLEFDASFFGSGHLVEVAGEPSETFGLLFDDGLGGVVPGEDAVGDAFEVGVEGGDGGAHLVGEVGQEASAGVLDVAEAVGHGVERVAEGAQFGAAAVDGDPCVVVARAEPAGRLG